MNENRVVLVGRVGATPEVKYLEPEVCSARLSLATNTEHFLDEYGYEQAGVATDWHKIVCYRALANWVETHVQLGMLLRVEGRLTYKVYRSGGQRMKSAFVLANKIDLIEEPNQPARRQPSAPAVEQPTDPYGKYLDALSQDVEEIPF